MIIRFSWRPANRWPSFRRLSARFLRLPNKSNNYAGRAKQWGPVGRRSADLAAAPSRLARTGGPKTGGASVCWSRTNKLVAFGGGIAPLIDFLSQIGQTRAKPAAEDYVIQSERMGMVIIAVLPLSLVFLCSYLLFASHQSARVSLIRYLNSILTPNNRPT